MSKAKGAICIVASAFGFALMALFVGMCDRYGASVSSFQKSFFRNLPAVFIAAAICRKPQSMPPLALTRRQWTMLVLRSAVGAAGIFCNFYALSHIAIGEGMTLNKMAPIWTVIMSWLFLKEKIDFRRGLFLLLAFVGAVLIIKPGFQGGGSFAYAMAALGGLCAGTAYVFVHALGRENVPSAFIVFFFSLFSCLAAVPFMIADWTPMTPVQLMIMAGAGIGGAIGQFGVTMAYRYAEPRDIAVYDYSNVIFAAILGFFFLSQQIDFISIAGMAIIGFAAHGSRRNRKID